MMSSARVTVPRSFDAVRVRFTLPEILGMREWPLGFML